MIWLSIYSDNGRNGHFKDDRLSSTGTVGYMALYVNSYILQSRAGINGSALPWEFKVICGAARLFHGLCKVWAWSVEQSREMSAFSAATKQFHESFNPSARPSHIFTMFRSSYHHEIPRSYYHWQKWWPCKSQGQRSTVKVTEVKTNFATIWA